MTSEEIAKDHYGSLSEDYLYDCSEWLKEIALQLAIKNEREEKRSMTNGMTIWKFPFDIGPWADIELPSNSRILSVQVQHGLPCLWAMVDPSAPKQRLRLRIYGTGFQIDRDGLVFLATIQMGSLVWHVFEVSQ